jgi:hypothetical protein
VGAVTDACYPRPYDPARYDAFACAVDVHANAYLVERLTESPDRPAPPLTDLVRTAEMRQQGWMEWKAALADGMAIGTAFLPPHAALRAARVVERLLSRNPVRGVSRTLSRDVAVGVLRYASGQQITEIADRLQLARSTVARALERHDAWMEDAPRYHDTVARALQNAVRRTLGPRRHALVLPMRMASVGADVDPGVA